MISLVPFVSPRGNDRLIGFVPMGSLAASLQNVGSQLRGTWRVGEPRLGSFDRVTNQEKAWKQCAFHEGPLVGRSSNVASGWNRARGGQVFIEQVEHRLCPLPSEKRMDARPNDSSGSESHRTDGFVRCPLGPGA
jgi:hypothetical protein